MFQKDVKIELATREVVTTAAWFVVLVVLIASLAFVGAGAQLAVAAGAMWVALAFALVLAISRLWAREREESAFSGLLTLPLSRAALFVGKAAGLGLLVLVLAAVALPVTWLLFGLDAVAVGPRMAVVVLVAVPGLSASGTLFGAMTVRTRPKDLVLAMVLFPLQAPTLLAAVGATREVAQGARLADIADQLLLMASFGLVFALGGAVLFGTLVDA